MQDLDYVSTTELIDALYERADHLVVYCCKEGRDGQATIKGDISLLGIVSHALALTVRDWRTSSKDSGVYASDVFAEHLEEAMETEAEEL